jgi:hypothetical protein
MIKSRKMRWVGHVALMGRRGMHVGYWWESEKEKPLGRPRCRWVDNIKMYLRAMDWIDLAHDMDQWRVLVSMVMNLRVP